MPPRTRDAPAGLLLCLVMREPLDTQRIANAARSIGSREAWEKLMSTAEERGVLQLMRRALSAASSGDLPQSALETLRGRCSKIIANNLLLVHELSRILELLRRNAISALAWKGPVLAGELYQNVALREFRDLDLLLRPEDVEKAGMILESAGYQRVSPSAPEGPDAHHRRGHEKQFTRDGQLVELHWAIAKSAHAVPFDFDGLWDRQRYVSVGKTDIPTLGVEDLFLSLCIHGTSHGWDRAIWVCDIARLIQRHPGLDISGVLSRADRQHFGRMIRVTLALVNELRLLTLSSAVVENVRQDNEAMKLATLLAGSMFTEQGTRHAFVQFHLRVRESLMDRARFVAKSLFLPAHEDWDAVPLPAWAAPLYYIIRPLRMTLKYARRTLALSAST
jgi:Uncharacterised nucleotidyltransferase